MKPIELDFSESTGTPAERRDAWRATLGASMDIDFPRDSADRFTGRFTAYPLGDLAIGEIIAGPHIATRTSETVRRIGLGHFYVNCFTRAGFPAEFDGRRMVIADGDCVAFDQQGPMRLRLNDMRCIYLLVPRPMMLRRLGSAAGLNGLRMPAATPQARLFGRMLETLLELAPTMPEAFATAVADSALALCVSCLQAQLPRTAAASRPAAAPGSSLPRIRRFIDRNISRTDLGPALLCTQFDLSRTVLYRLFQPLGGVHDYILSRRTGAAHHWLALGPASELTLPEIARRAGFVDERSFRRAIKAAYGVPPSRLRAAAAAPAANDASPGEALADFLDQY